MAKTSVNSTEVKAKAKQSIVEAVAPVLAQYEEVVQIGDSSWAVLVNGQWVTLVLTAKQMTATERLEAFNPHTARQEWLDGKATAEKRKLENAEKAKAKKEAADAKKAERAKAKEEKEKAEAGAKAE